MQQLTGLDASFLYLETPKTPMHIGGVMIYDQRTVKGGKLRFKDILDHFESRLHLARTFRQKLVHVPFNLDHPYWIEDRDFDLEYHVRHIRLPEPGDWRQLCIQVARLHSRPLDLTKPLWEFTIIEGLDDIDGLPRGSFAVVTKIHHACIDGVSGVDMVEAIHDVEPYVDRPAGPVTPWKGEQEPSALELVVRAQVHNMTQPYRLAEVLARTVPALGRLGQRATVADAERASLAPPRTRFNHVVSAHRVIEGRRFDLAEIRAIKDTVDGATVNDVVLAVCGGALRRYLLAKHELPGVPMIAMAPISVRGSDEKGAMGNRISAMTVSLGTHIEDPIERLGAIHEAAAASKGMSNAVGAKLLTDYSQFIPSTTAAMAARLYVQLGLSERVNIPFNCVVTNVPGPQFPLYSAGAKLLAQYGLGPIFDGMGLMFPVFSYNGKLFLSVTSCREMMPDPEFFSECMQAAFDELKAAALVVPEAADASLASGTP
jgi:WS/DGAT/MGAT family acyltransferase